MATIEGTQENFSSLAQEGITLVDFWAEWCGPCRKFAPIFEEASERYPDVNFVKVDVEAQQELAAGANITSIPTIFGIKDGSIVFSQPGVMNGKNLDSLIEQIRVMDLSKFA